MKPGRRFPLVLFAACLFLVSAMPGQVALDQTSSGIITTAVGASPCHARQINGHEIEFCPQGFSGDGGPALGAMLSLPAGVAVDSSGNLFIADEMNNRVRRVDATTGIITTVAGSGVCKSGKCTAGFSGDDGPATKAELNHPHSVALDAEGNLFICDLLNLRVRRVDHATGIITTVAGKGTRGSSGDGGPATSAELRGPLGVAVDASGNFFIADSSTFTDPSHHRIRRVDASTGTITTVAGGGTCCSGIRDKDGLATEARLDTPAAVLVDASGNLFIAEPLRLNRVRRVDHATGIISTVAGASCPRPSGSCGPAFDGDGGPAREAHLATPSGLAMDASGNLFIADAGNHRIRRVDHATGVITTVAGSGGHLFGGDGGPATSAGLNFPKGVAVDADGKLFIADTNDNRVRRVEKTSTGDVVAAVTKARRDHSPTLAPPRVAPGKTAVGQTGLGIITTIAGDQRCGPLPVRACLGGFGGDERPAKSAWLLNPSGMAVDASGNLFIADALTHRIRRVDGATGLITTVAGSSRCDGAKCAGGFRGDGGSATSAELNSPRAVAVNADGNLFIADTGNNRIRRIDGFGIITTVVGKGTKGFSGDDGPATNAELNEPWGVALDGDGNLFVADSRNMRVRRVQKTTGIITTFASSSRTSSGNRQTPVLLTGQPTAVFVDASGDLLIAELHAVRRVDHLTGTVTPVAGGKEHGFAGDDGPATSAQLHSPTAIAEDASGNLFIADTGNHRIRRVDHATGIITTVAGDGEQGFSGDGGPATRAEFSLLFGLAVDRSATC